MAILSIEQRERLHRSRILTGMLIVVLAISVSFDLAFYLQDPTYWRRLFPFAAGRNGFILALLLLNYFGLWLPAAIGVVAMFPISIGYRVASGLALDPSRTLAYLVLDVPLAGLLFAVRGTLAVAAMNVATIAFLAWRRPELGLGTMAGFAMMSIVTAAMVVAGVRHRASVEATRRAELEASEARKSAMLETAQDCILAIDRDGRLIEFNPAAERVFGYRRADVIGRVMTELIVPPEHREAHRRGLARIVGGGAPRIIGTRVETTALRADGTEFPCEIGIAASGSGAAMVFTAHLRDLTERRLADARQGELEEQLRESQKMQAVGQLAGGVAHDFNNTLQAIGGYLSFALAEARLKAPELAADLEEAERAAKRAAGLTRQLLAFSRRQPLDLEVVALNDVVNGFLGIVRRAVSERVAVRFHPGVDLPAVRVDQGQIQQVILNLSLNARDAMPDGGELTVETEEVTVSDAFAAAHPWSRAGTFVALVVADTGLGMTPEVHGRMFEPFFSTKGPDRGTGLGLAVVYGIVQQHRGFVRVDTAPGAGTSFRIYLPVATVPVSAARADDGPHPPGGSETVLVADDSDAIRDVICRVLQTAGYRVIAAGNGEEAVRRFEQAPGAVDMVLLDAVMPRRSGREAFIAMRALRPDLPALFVSGYSADTIDSGWLQQVGAELVTKPIAPSELLRRVRRVLDARTPVDGERA